MSNQISFSNLTECLNNRISFTIYNCTFLLFPKYCLRFISRKLLKTFLNFISKNKFHNIFRSFEIFYSFLAARSIFILRYYLYCQVLIEFSNHVRHSSTLILPRALLVYFYVIFLLYHISEECVIALSLYRLLLSGIFSLS